MKKTKATSRKRSDQAALDELIECAAGLIAPRAAVMLNAVIEPLMPEIVDIIAEQVAAKVLLRLGEIERSPAKAATAKRKKKPARRRR